MSDMGVEMIIYGEYLFLENFVVTLLILVLTGKLTGYIPKAIRMMMGAIVGAISSFIIFVPMTPALSILVRVLLGLSCIFVTFGRRNIIKLVLLYFALTFTSGGMVMALCLWIQKPVIAHQGIIYMESLTYLKLFSIGVLAFGFTYWFISFIRNRNKDNNLYGMVCIEIEKKQYCFRAFMDSGNSLVEPISGRPVILIDGKGAKSLPFSAKDMPMRYGLIPYKTVGSEHGNLEGIRSDRITFDGNTIENGYVAFYDGRFKGYEVLMHRDFLERGLLGNEY